MLACLTTLHKKMVYLVTLTKALPEQTEIIKESMLAHIDGVECWHSRNDAQTTNHYVKFAKEHGLVKRGSDCHQKPVIMGTVKIPAYASCSPIPTLSSVLTIALSRKLLPSLKYAFASFSAALFSLLRTWGSLILKLTLHTPPVSSYSTCRTARAPLTLGLPSIDVSFNEEVRRVGHSLKSASMAT